MKTDMPKVIRLTGRRINMVLETSLLNRSIQGHHDGWNNRIVLDSSQAPDELRATALHEVMHDLDSMVGAELGERGVTCLSSVLFAALRDNPEFVRWLMDWPK